MNKTDRLYAIVEELRAAGPAGRTSAWLAHRFEVATRTIKRDVSALQQAGVPIWADGGPGGGYVLDAATTLPPITFTPGEAVAVAAALAAAVGLPFGADGRSALTKITGAMGDTGREQAAGLAGRVWINDETTPTASGPPRHVIEEAIRRELVVVLDYQDRAGRVTTKRPVEPMVIARTGGQWYLMAWCRRRRAGRWFRLDRIVAAHLTAQHAEPRDLVAVFGEPPEGAAPLPL